MHLQHQVTRKKTKRRSRLHLLQQHPQPLCQWTVASSAVLTMKLWWLPLPCLGWARHRTKVSTHLLFCILYYWCGRGGWQEEMWLNSHSDPASSLNTTLDWALPGTFSSLLFSSLDVPVSVLLVGLGGGGLPQFLRDFVPNVTVEVVELDPVVMEVAKQWFGFRPDDHLTVTLGDGLEHICTLEKEG